MTTQQVQTTDGTPLLSTTEGFVLLAKFKPGQADAFRAAIKEMAAHPEALGTLERIGTVHFARFAIIEDTYLLFTSWFDGSVEDYLDDFYADSAGENFDRWLRYCEGWPGPHDRQAFVDFWMSHQVQDLGRVSSYPGVTVKEIQRALRVRKNLEAVLEDFQ